MFRNSFIQKTKKKINFWVFYCASFVYVRRDFFVRAFNVTAEAVNAIMAMPTETRAALLNSGTFGVEVAVELDDGGLVGLAVEGVAEETDT